MLAFGWVAFLVTTVIAGVAILFTGRYPRAAVRLQRRLPALELAGRVLRRTPPSARTDTRRSPWPETDYPADLDVEYPEHLSRGLVLVKWLLAIPHLVVVGLIAAAILPYWWTDIDWISGLQSIGGYSMLNLLVVLAGFFLLITRQYPRGLFDLLMGINRWLYRVLTYVALMHDEYPPFRLDQGQYELTEVEPVRPASTPLLVHTPA